VLSSPAELRASQARPTAAVSLSPVALNPHRIRTLLRQAIQAGILILLFSFYFLSYPFLSFLLLHTITKVLYIIIDDKKEKKYVPFSTFSNILCAGSRLMPENLSIALRGLSTIEQVFGI